MVRCEATLVRAACVVDFSSAIGISIRDNTPDNRTDSMHKPWNKCPCFLHKLMQKGDLAFLREQIERVDSNFNMTDDKDLVESYIYESNALAARYRFLLRTAKEQRSRLGNAVALIGITE